MREHNPPVFGHSFAPMKETFFIESPEGEWLTAPDCGTRALTISPYDAWTFEDGYCWPVGNNHKFAFYHLRFLQEEIPELYRDYTITKHEFWPYD